MKDDVDSARRHLVRGDQDAPILLALTYESAPPNEVLRRLEPLSKGWSLGRTYYDRLLRRARPEIVLIPQDWQSLHSPRIAIAASTLDRYPVQDGSVPALLALLIPPALGGHSTLAASLLCVYGIGVLGAFRVRDRWVSEK
jgi:hypothetical protein